MKIKEIQQLKKKPLPELEKELREKREKLWQLKNDLATGKVKNIREIREIKKIIARVLTFIKQYDN